MKVTFIIFPGKTSSSFRETGGLKNLIKFSFIIFTRLAVVFT